MFVCCYAAYNTTYLQRADTHKACPKPTHNGQQCLLRRGGIGIKGNRIKPLALYSSSAGVKLNRSMREGQGGEKR